MHLKFIHNTSWLLLEKIVRMVVALVTTIFLARYLGVSEFGKLSYVIALIGMFLPFAALGMDQVIVRRLSNGGNPSKVLGSAFFLRLLMGLLLIILIPNIHGIVETGELSSFVNIASYILLFYPFYLIDPYFQSILKVKYIAIAKVLSLLLMLIVRLIAIRYDASFDIFIQIILLEYIVTALFFTVTYVIKNSVHKIWTASFNTSLAILKESWPIIFSGAAVALYTRLDQIMLQIMAGSEAAGYYAATVRISEAAFFIPVILVQSALPVISKMRDRNPSLYFNSIKLLYEVLNIIGIIVVVTIVIFNEQIISIMYGESYKYSAVLLSAMIFTVPIVFFGVAKGIWTICEGRQTYNMIYTLIGLVLNIMLNYLLIPIYGGMGAVIATISSQAAINILLPMLSVVDRASVILFLESFSFKEVRKYIAKTYLNHEK
jgi:O-antigen/teichoic acid export membrane protein